MPKPNDRDRADEDVTSRVFAERDIADGEIRESEIIEVDIHERAAARQDGDDPLGVPTDVEAEQPVVRADTPVSSDPADAIPVPVAMSAAEIDKRAEAVEVVRGVREPEPEPDPGA
jgi:hypothetical protein